MKFRKLSLPDRTIISIGKFKAVYENENPDYGYVLYQNDEPFLGGICSEQEAMSAMGQYHMESDPRLTHHGIPIIN